MVIFHYTEKTTLTESEELSKSMTQEIYQIQTGDTCNLIYESPHVGRLTLDITQRHTRLVSAAANRADSYIDQAGAYLLSQTGGTWIYNTISRLVVDLNRGADRVDSRVCPRWPGARVHKDGGVIVPFTRQNKQAIQLYDSPLDEDEVEARLRYYWYPYHERLRQLIDSTLEMYMRVIVISLHSAHPFNRHQTINRPVIYLGTRNGETCDPSILESIQSELESRGNHVVSRGYYQGAYTTQAYGVEPRIHTIQIELDRRFLPPLEERTDIPPQVIDLAQTLRAVSVSNRRAANPARRRMYSSRTFFDPLSGEVKPF